MDVRRAKRIAAAAVIAWSATASPFLARIAAAEERLHLDTLPDEALYGLTLQDRDGVRYPWRLELHGAFEGAARAGAAADRARSITASAGMGLGLWSSPVDFLQLRSETSLPMPFPTPGPVRWSDLDGAHRVHGEIGLGGLDGDRLREGARGVDVEVEGSTRHAGRYGTSFLDRAFGANPFWDARAALTAWPRYAALGDMAITMPVRASIRRAAAEQTDGDHGFQSIGASTGFGVRPHVYNISRGWFEIFHVGYEKTRFFAPSRVTGHLSGVERIDLRFLHIDGLVGSAERGTNLMITAYLGGAWLWDAATHRALSVFTSTVAGRVSTRAGKERQHRFGVGLGGGRDGGFFADGSALVDRWRAEAFLDLDLAHETLGGSVRAAGEHLDAPSLGEARRDLGVQAAIATEWYFGVVRSLEIGFHHATTQRCSADAPAAHAPFCHQLGGFVRISDRLSRGARERSIVD